MSANKKLIYTSLFILLPFLTILAQMKVFVAPKSADAVINPLKGNASATVEGKKTYTTFCTPCHGQKGKGDGAASAGLSKKPADHTSTAIQSQTDGALFWMLSEGNTPMPAYKKIITATQRWQLINYIRTLKK